MPSSQDSDPECQATTHHRVLHLRPSGSSGPSGGTGCLLHQRLVPAAADNHQKVFLRKNGQLPSQTAAGQQQPQMMVVRAGRGGSSSARTAVVLGNGRLTGAALNATTAPSDATEPGQRTAGSGGFSSLSASSVSAVQAASSNHKPGYINVGPERII